MDGKYVYLSPPAGIDLHGEVMRFRLTYDGPLQSTQRDAVGGQRDPNAQHKHEIRRQFHPQLKRLWETSKFLSGRWGDIGIISASGFGEEYMGDGDKKPFRECVADLYQENGFRFVPLVREEWTLLCELEVLFLRFDPPGEIFKAGDLDNRIKTLIDGLRKPKDANELAGNSPADGEDPFYILMEDDSQVTSLSVETDTLLDPTHLPDRRWVRLVISVTLRPYHVNNLTLHFA